MVMESTGSVLPDNFVTLVGDETKLTRAQTSSGTGSYDFVNLPLAPTPSHSPMTVSRRSGCRQSWCRPIAPQP
jgi:hypothetical protein